MVICNKKIYANEKDLEKLSLEDNFEALKKEKEKIINLGKVYFHPTQNLKKNLSYVLVFAENLMKRDIPSGSVWHFKDTNYRPEILRDDVGCGMTMFLMTDTIPCQDWIKVLRNYSIGGGNHFLNIGKFNENMNFLLLHADLNEEKTVPKSVQEAKQMVEDASRKREQLIQSILQELGISGELFKDWPHNSIQVEEGQTTYLKGVVDSKKSQGVGLMGLTPIDGSFLYLQIAKNLNGYMQHGIGVKNYNFKKFYKKDLINPNLSYLTKETAPGEVNDSFIEYKETIGRFWPKYIFLDNILENDLTFRMR